MTGFTLGWSPSERAESSLRQNIEYLIDIKSTKWNEIMLQLRRAVLIALRDVSLVPCKKYSLSRVWGV